MWIPPADVEGRDGIEARAAHKGSERILGSSLIGTELNARPRREVRGKAGRAVEDVSFSATVCAAGVSVKIGTHLDGCRGAVVSALVGGCSSEHTLRGCSEKPAEDVGGDVVELVSRKGERSASRRFLRTSARCLLEFPSISNLPCR